MSNPTTTAREALKNCPFCGGTDIELAESSVPKIDDRGQKEAIFCNSCFCEGPVADNESEALDAWNTRALATEAGEVGQLRAEVERLREENGKMREPFANVLNLLDENTQLRARIADLEARPVASTGVCLECKQAANSDGSCFTQGCPNRKATPSERTDAERLRSVIENHWTFQASPGGTCYLMRGDAVVASGDNPIECIDAAMQAEGVGE